MDWETLLTTVYVPVSDWYNEKSKNHNRSAALAPPAAEKSAPTGFAFHGFLVSSFDKNPFRERDLDGLGFLSTLW
jgi:hypothetical protein